MSGYLATLRVLVAHDVEFIVVGGVAAVLQGAPIVTFDIDILHRRTPENVAKLLAALREMSAVYRTDPRRLSPGESHLMGPGHQLLHTRLGDLDVLGTIDMDVTYDDVKDRTIDLDIGVVRVLVLEMSRLIEAKQAAGRPKDIAVLPVLQATLAEIRKSRST
jgi:hypothetical protein